ncbi:MAG: hypothetical protein AMXMBFR7_36880 [Planctomycetota bacterium]
MTIWSKMWTAAKTVLPDTRTGGESLRDVADPTLERAAARAMDVVDRAAQHEHELLEDGEMRARRLVEDVDSRVDAQRERLLDRTEHVCDRITRRLVVRVLVVGLVLVGATGAVAVAAVWAAKLLR